MIRVTDVTKNFETHAALRGISLDVAEGEVVAIIGPSGSGKSTLLRCLNGLEQITSGEVEIDGRLLVSRRAGQQATEMSAHETRGLRAEIGMVFQHFNLFPHMTALENIIEAPMHVRGLNKDDAFTRANALLAKVNLADRTRHYPDQLSGGEKQRVAIARALAMQPKVILFDEATSALDPETVGDVLGVMRQLAQEGMTMVVVTHEMQFARAVAGRVIVMDAGQVVEEGPAQRVLTEPREKRAQTFLRRVLEREWEQ